LRLQISPAITTSAQIINAAIVKVFAGIHEIESNSLSNAANPKSFPTAAKKNIVDANVRGT
jgi:hypothetical protein